MNPSYVCSCHPNKMQSRDLKH